MIGKIYEGLVNNARIEVVDVQTDSIFGTKSVIYKDLKTGKVFEYGYEAFKRLLIKEV